MKLLITFQFVLMAILSLSCNQAKKQEDNSKSANLESNTIYFNGDIITMEGEQPQYVEAVVEAEGKIIYAGNLKSAEKNYTNASKFDLDGKVLLPGFIEPHLHPSIAAIMLPNVTIAPHDWNKPDGVSKAAKTPEEYRKRLAEAINKNTKTDEMFFIWGYHQLWHGELSREMLNKLSPDKPVGVIHRSFHEIYINDKAIELFKIKEDNFKNNPQVDWNKGHFFEGGWLALVPIIGPQLINPDTYRDGLRKMTQLMLRNGITTINEPGFPSSNFELEYSLLKEEMDKNPPYDVYLIPNGTQLYGMNGNSNEKTLAMIESLPAKYNSSNITFLPKQIKLFSDGAIYSLAMQMKEPYLSKDFKGEWMTLPLSLFQEQLSFYWNNDFKIHVHSNGDLGIQQVIDFNKVDQKRYPRVNHRFTLHHMGYFDVDIAQQIKDLGMESSVNPYYLWALADKYSEYGLGKERAENLVRIKELTDRDVPVSFHSDFAMAPAEPLTLAWTAINRETAEHSKFSQDQRIDVYTALKGITISAARTLNLEDAIGSIKVGKRANFTVLKENPFKIDPIKIKDIEIDGIIYHGVYHKSN
ncbi:amidohydrolase [Namhaeicola litoreus]|uniref:Amidohydrolase n=1 Tax=Namhaeicola litoreus TaxID=1052145 RepID=A0ABW3Y0B4_9FLAO